MRTFLQRVNALTGLVVSDSSSPSTSELLQFIKDGANDIINRLQLINPGAVAVMAKETSVPSGGTATIEGEIISVYGTEAAANRPAVPIDSSLRFLASDSTSIYYQSKFNPAYYRKGSEIGIVPQGGVVLHVSKPEIGSVESVDIPNFPDKYLHIVDLYSAIQTLKRDLASKEDAMALLAYTPPGAIGSITFTGSLPDDLTVPSFPYIPTELKSITGGTSVSRTSIDASIPQYSQPVLTIPTLPVINDINLPTAPVAPSSSDVSLSFNVDTNKPVYNKPSLVLPAFPVFSDLSFTGIAANPPSEVATPSLVGETISDFTIGNLPAPPIYIKPKVLGIVEELMETQPSITSAATLDTIDTGGKNLEEALETLWAYIKEEEDPEQASSVANFISTVVNLYTTQMTNNMNEFNSRVQEYTQETQKTMQQAQMDRAKLDKQSDMNWQSSIAQYEKVLAKHQADVALYQAEINSQLQEWQTQNLTYKVAKWNNEVSHSLQEHSQSMQNELNKFNEMDRLYQKGWEKAVQDATISGQNINNDFLEFDKKLTAYTQEINGKVQEYTQNELLKKWEIYKFDYQQSLAKHAADSTTATNVFNADNTKFQAELTIAQTNAGNIQAALMSQMQADTELAKHNSVQEFTSNLTKFQQDLANFSTQVNKYTASISTQQSEYNTKISKYGQEMQNALNAFNSAKQVKETDYAWKQSRIVGLMQEYNQALGLLKQQKGES